MEITTKVETYMITKQCDKCKKGIMDRTGKGVTTFKTSWEHQCSNCGVIEWYEKKYPVIFYNGI